MPTGYTADIAKGITFEKFAMDCARAFGACIMLRDEPNATIPEEFKPSDHNSNAFAAAKHEMEILLRMSPEEADRMAAEHHRKELADAQRRVQEKRDLLDKYEAMLQKVNSWTPPSGDHVGLKKFMLEQIRSSIDWDCDTTAIEYPPELTGKEWLQNRVTAVAKDINYHAKAHAEEVQRTADRNRWIKQLRDSLK